MFNDDSQPPSSRPATRLLNELESIKGALSDDEEGNRLVDIPLLDDMVIHNLDDNAKLLNIHQIFEEGEPAEDSIATPKTPIQFPRFKLDAPINDAVNIAREQPSTSAAAKASVRPDYSREVLIQELVDEFIPQIEAALHKRLQQLDDAALRRLKDSE